MSPKMLMVISIIALILGATSLGLVINMREAIKGASAAEDLPGTGRRPRVPQEVRNECVEKTGCRWTDTGCQCDEGVVNPQPPIKVVN